MNDTIHSTLPEITTACPDWCSLQPGHEYDSIHDDGRYSRGHGGPRFGPYLHAGADEFAHEPGVLHPAVDLEADPSDKARDLSPTDLMLLVVHATEARDWLVEALRTDVLR